MPLTKKEFGDNLISLLIENNINISSEDKFIIKPIKEKNVSYNSFDDYVRIWFLQEKNINRYFYFQEAIDFLSFSNERYPLWIKVVLFEKNHFFSIFELYISMRFRKPSELKYKELGHPPFIFEDFKNNELE